MLGKIPTYEPEEQIKHDNDNLQRGFWDLHQI